MKTKHEKSFEQEALEMYAREQAGKQYQKLVNKIGLIVGLVSPPILFTAACYYLKPAAPTMAILLIPIGLLSMAIGFLGMVQGLLFAPDHR